MNSACWRKSLKTTPRVCLQCRQLPWFLCGQICFTSVGDRFPEILLIMFQTLLMDVRLFIDETKFCYDWRLAVFIVLLAWPRMTLYSWIFSQALHLPMPRGASGAVRMLYVYYVWLDLRAFWPKCLFMHQGLHSLSCSNVHTSEMYYLLHCLTL